MDKFAFSQSSNTNTSTAVPPRPTPAPLPPTDITDLAPPSRPTTLDLAPINRDSTFLVIPPPSERRPHTELKALPLPESSEFACFFSWFAYYHETPDTLPYDRKARDMRHLDAKFVALGLYAFGAYLINEGLITESGRVTPEVAKKAFQNFYSLMARQSKSYGATPLLTDSNSSLTGISDDAIGTNPRARAKFMQSYNQLPYTKHAKNSKGVIGANYLRATIPILIALGAIPQPLRQRMQETIEENQNMITRGRGYMTLPNESVFQDAQVGGVFLLYQYLTKDPDLTKYDEDPASAQRSIELRINSGSPQCFKSELQQYLNTTESRSINLLNQFFGVSTQTALEDKSPSTISSGSQTISKAEPITIACTLLRDGANEAAIKYVSQNLDAAYQACFNIILNGINRGNPLLLSAINLKAFYPDQAKSITLALAAAGVDRKGFESSHNRDLDRWIAEASKPSLPRHSVDATVIHNSRPDDRGGCGYGFSHS
jgi:hypothetical protein